MSRTTEETREFQTEVRELLNIVINSLYTEREIFLRELVSNAADALEKLRYLKLTRKDISDVDSPLEIRIDVDEQARSMSIVDTGIGMTREELIENIGTIAHSGSKTFIEQLQKNSETGVDLIGRFGVGFYSSFMVADHVTVASRSYRPEEPGTVWSSDGLGSYTVAPGEDLKRGTRITIKLKEDAREFADAEKVKRIIKTYSSFVPFPIFVNGERVNTLKAIWTKNKKEVTDAEYMEFYKFIANTNEEPLFWLHFSTDAPLAINAVLYVPADHFERLGFGRMEPGVNLYSRKVLIQSQSGEILPEWMRFIKGVVDSEELPLNISRETLQDSSVLPRINRVITGKLLKYLEEQSRTNPDKFTEFWNKFGMFIREGAASDPGHQKALVDLMRFESSHCESGELVSLKDYVQRMPEAQEAVYYLYGPSRESMEENPFLEVFREKGWEVLYTYEPADDYILTQLQEYAERKLLSADRADIQIELSDRDGDGSLSEDKAEGLAKWLRTSLGDRVSEVRVSKRLADSPALVVDAGGMSNALRRVMESVHKELVGGGQKILEINRCHRLITRLDSLREEDEEFAVMIAEQILDNALISAGLSVDSKAVVSRMYDIMSRAL